MAFYNKGYKVMAVASMNYDPMVPKVAEVLGSGSAIQKLRVRGQQGGWGGGDLRRILALRERILSSHAADLGRHTEVPGTEAKPWASPISQDPPGQNLSPSSACLQLPVPPPGRGPWSLCFGLQCTFQGKRQTLSKS